MRSVQMTKPVLTTLKMIIPEAVALPYFTRSLKDGVLAPGEEAEKAALTMLDELARWTSALETLRS